MTDFLLLVVIASCLGLFMATALWLARVSARRGPTPQASMPVGPTMAVTAQIFALILALHGNSLWGGYQRADADLTRLHASLDSLGHLAGSELLAPSPLVVEAAGRYAALVRDRDWRAHATPEAARELEAALQALRIEVARAGAGMSAPLHASLLLLFDEVAKAHSERMRAHGIRPNVMIWIGLVVLCFLSNVIIALVHQDRPAAASRALLVFDLASGVTFWLMMQYEFRVPLHEGLRGMGLQ